MSGMRERVQRIARLAKGKTAPAAETLRVDVIELVNWVYAEQRAHEVDGRGIGLHEGEMVAEGLLNPRNVGSGSSIGGFEEMMRLGCIIRREGYDMGDLHPVAEVVHDLVVHHAGGLVIRFAAKRDIPPGGKILSKLGPSWKSEPAYDHRGAPRPGAFAIKYDHLRHPWYCPLAVDHGPDYIAELRAEYAAWHDGLAALVAACAKARHRLAGMIVTATKLPREPWCDETATESAPLPESRPERRPGMLTEHIALMKMLDDPKRWFSLGEIIARRTAPAVASDAMQWLIDHGLVDQWASTQAVRLSASGRDALEAFR